MKRLLFLFALLPALLIGQTTNTKLSQNLLLEVLSGQNALTGANLVTNGTFDTSTTGWSVIGGGTLSVETGMLKITNGNYGGAQQNITVESGSTYSITFSFKSGTAGAAMALGSTSGAHDYAQIWGSSSVLTSIQRIIKATSTTLSITPYIDSGTASVTAYFDNIVVRKIHSHALTSPDPSYTLTNSGAIPTYWHKGNNSYYAFDGVDDYIPISLSAFGTGDFSVIARIKTTDLSATNNIISAEINGFVIYILSTGKIQSVKASAVDNTQSSISLSPNTEYVIGYTRTGTSATYYVNGVADNTITDANDYTVASSKIGYPAYSVAAVNSIQVFNYALSADTVAFYSDPSNHLKAADNDGSGHECVLSLTPEGMLGSATQGIWRDNYHSTDIPLSGATAPRLVRSWSGMNAWRFNGTTSYLSLADASAPQLTGDITVSFYLTVDAIKNYNVILYNGKFDIYTDSNARIGITRAASSTAISAAILVVNTRYHVVITSTSTGITNIYVNGVLSGAANQNAATPAEGISDLKMGSDGTYFAGGIIEDLRIYKEIWSAEKIALDYLQ